MTINSKTLLFENLSYAEAEELYCITKMIILEGEIPKIYHPLFSRWMKASGPIYSHNYLLMASIVFPQRALFSVIEFERAKKG